VAQVHIRTRVGADTGLVAISRKVRVPAPVLEPAFDNARAHGYLSGGDDRLEVTEAGELEIGKLIMATRAWLASELTDWDADNDELLTKALGEMAKKFVEEEAESNRTLALAGAT
jgi:hypothetical protein